MGVIEDVRKVVQDLVAPELKSLSVQLDRIESESKLRDESLAKELRARDDLMLARLETQSAKLEAFGAKMDYQYASIMNALNVDRRHEVLERDKQHSAPA
jgi:uncharacterized membrane-anchored protein